MTRGTVVAPAAQAFDHISELVKGKDESYILGLLDAYLMIYGRFPGLSWEQSREILTKYPMEGDDDA